MNSSKDKRDAVKRDESSGFAALDKLNEAAKEVLGPADRGPVSERGVQEEPTDAERRQVAREHGDRISEDADGNPIAISEDSKTD